MRLLVIQEITDFALHTAFSIQVVQLRSELVSTPKSFSVSTSGSDTFMTSNCIRDIEEFLENSLNIYTPVKSFIGVWRMHGFIKTGALYNNYSPTKNRKRMNM